MGAVTSFHARAAQHDGPALTTVIGAFKGEGFHNFRFGSELDSPLMRDALRQRDDPTSILLRYRPDQVFSHPGARTVLCELKSEKKGYPNFAVEADAYLAGLDWNKLHRHVMYAFCDLAQQTYWACWADEIPRPTTIYVPKFHCRFVDSMRRLPKAFPEADVSVMDWGEGSGTPYFLVPKPRPGLSSPLRPLGLFIRHDVWAAVTAMTPKVKRGPVTAKNDGRIPLDLLGMEPFR